MRQWESEVEIFADFDKEKFFFEGTNQEISTEELEVMFADEMIKVVCPMNVIRLQMNNWDFKYVKQWYKENR